MKRTILHIRHHMEIVVFFLKKKMKMKTIYVMSHVMVHDKGEYTMSMKHDERIQSIDFK